MRCVCAIALSLLCACQSAQVEVSKFSGNTLSVDPAEVVSPADAKLLRAAARVKPVAEAMCRAKNPDATKEHCAFNVKVVAGFGQQPNAFLERGRDGGSVIVVNRTLLDQVGSEDELAFVLAHEAGHQIANHLHKASFQDSGAGLSRSKGQVAIGLRTADLKRMELEADVIGTVIAFKAGFDPSRGAKALNRFADVRTSGGATHPHVQARLNVVTKTIVHLRAGNEISF